MAGRIDSIGGVAMASQMRPGEFPTREDQSPPLPCADGVSNLVCTRWVPRCEGFRLPLRRGACAPPSETAPVLDTRLKLSPGITYSAGTPSVYPRPGPTSSPIEPGSAVSGRGGRDLLEEGEERAQAAADGALAPHRVLALPKQLVGDVEGRQQQRGGLVPHARAAQRRDRILEVAGQRLQILR